MAGDYLGLVREQRGRCLQREQYKKDLEKQHHCVGFAGM